MIMDKGTFRKIAGIEEFWRYFPDVSWSHFHDVLEFRWFRDFDYEEWCDRNCLELKISSIDRKDIVQFVFKDVIFVSDVHINGWISGLDILNRTRDYQKKTYEVIDFEDHHIHMYCGDFSIKVIQADGVMIGS